MEKRQSRAIDLLADVDEFLGGGRTARTSARYARARRSLSTWLEQFGEQSLEQGTMTLLAAEREFDARGAYLRVASVEDVVYALRGYVLALPSLFSTSELADVRAVLRYLTTFTDFAVRYRHVNSYDHSCVLLDLRAALRETRAMIASAVR
jgi:hypothetical protein